MTLPDDPENVPMVITEPQYMTRVILPRGHYIYTKMPQVQPGQVIQESHIGPLHVIAAYMVGDRQDVYTRNA